MDPVRIPGNARGSVWWSTACMSEAPTASAASRIDAGVAWSAARAAIITVGRVINASTRPPTSGAERGIPKTPRNTDSPSRPNTIDGTRPPGC